MKRIIFPLLLFFSFSTFAQDLNINKSLKGFDDYVSKVLNDWNAPGAGIAIIYKDTVVYAKGFGYRDYENKLPVTTKTLFAIASNTKLFTSVAAGFLVEEYLLTWDSPIKNSVPEIEFYNDFLNRNVTLRDMLGHKTGISRHDMIHHQSDLTGKELFEKLKYLEPSAPLRTKFIYNNLMVATVGYCIELKTGKTWEDFVSEKLLKPLEMENTSFTFKEMVKQSDYGIAYNEKRDTNLLYRIELHEICPGAGPAGSIISNLEDMSHWVIALMNNGYYNGNSVISANIIEETLKPGLEDRDIVIKNEKFKEILCCYYGMGRDIEVYKGHLLSKHGGHLSGYFSQVAVLPHDSIGIVSFVLGEHAGNVPNIIMYNAVDRILGLEQTDWNARRLEDLLKRKEYSKLTDAKVGFDQVPGTKPTHELGEYVGTYHNEVYGEFRVDKKNDSLYFNFRKTVLPLNHYHYNRFDTPYDEDLWKWSLNFQVNPQGDIGSVIITIEEGRVEFIKKPDESLFDPEILIRYTGKYEIAGSIGEVILKDKKLIFIEDPTDKVLIPYKKNIFKVEKYDDIQLEFILENDRVTGLKYKTPYRIYELNLVK